MDKLVEETITPRSLDLFLEYARDAGNWGGSPLVGGNVGGTKEDRGNLTQLKKAKLIRTFRQDGFDWIMFEPAGIELAAAHGIDVLSSY